MIINKKLLDDLAPVKEDNSSSWFKSTSKTKKIKKLWEDGYDVGDVTKTILNVGDTILSSTADALTNVGKGFMSTVEGTVDAGRYFLGDAMKKSANLQADIWNKLGNKSYADSLRKSGQQLFDFEKKNAKVDVTGALLGETNDIFKENWSKKVDEKSIFAEKSDSVAQGVGNVGAFVGMSNIAPVLGGNEIGTVGSFLNSFSSSYGNSRTEAYKNGADDETANKAGLINGFAEAISEQFFDGMPGMKSAGWGDKLVGKIGESVSKYFNGNVGKNVMKILDASGEGFEEIISNALVTTGNNIAHYFDKNYTYGMENQSGNVIKDIGDSITSQESWDAFISAMLTSAITNGGAKLINQTQNNHIIKEYAKENNMTVDEVKAQFNDIANRTLNQEVTDNYKDKAELEEQIKKNLASNIKDDIKSGQNNINLSEIQQGLMSRENYIKAVGHKTTDANGKQVYTTSSEGLNLIESYRAYGGDESKISEINNIQKFMNKRNLEARFDATKFYDKKVNAIWQIEDGKRSVIFDPNTSIDSIIEEVAAHEMTHDIISQNTKSSNSFFKDVLDYAKQNKEYKTLRKDIEDSYSEYYDKTSNDFSNKIDEEIVAKTIEEQLGTQEYITRVVNNNPNLAQKMYRWVIDKLQTSNTIKDDNNEVTGFKNEKIYWEGVKNKFEKAYNEQSLNKSENDTKFALLLYNKIDKTTKIQDKRISDAYKLQKKGYNEDFIWAMTGVRFVDNQDALFYVEDLKFKKDINLLDLKPGKYALNEIMEGPLLENIRQLKNLNFELIDYEQEVLNNGVSKEDAKKFGEVAGSSSLDDGISINTKYINKIKNEQNPSKIVENILAHEVQHIIQSVEYGESEITAYFNYDEKTKKLIYTEENPIDAKHKYRNNPKEIESEVTRIQNFMTPEQRRKIPLNLLFNEVKSYYRDKKNLNPIKPQQFINQLFGKYGYNLEMWYNDIKAGDTNELFKTYDYGNRENIKEQNNEVVSFRRNQRNVSGKNGTSNFGNASLFVAKSGSDTKRGNQLFDETKLKNNELDNSSFNLQKDNKSIKQQDQINNKNNGDNTKKYSISKNGKMVDNSTNKEITFDTAELSPNIPIRDDKKLMAMHNLSESKLKGILELGGIPVPSIAITNPNKIDHNQYGEITALFEKSTIDPAIKENEVYDRDVWSPTFPQIDYNLDTTDLKEISDELGLKSYELEDYAESNNTPEYLANVLTRDEKIVDKYVKENNIDYKEEYKKTDMLVAFHKLSNEIQKFIIDNDFDVNKLVNSQELRQQYFELIEKYYNNSDLPSPTKEYLYNEKINQLNDFIEHQSVTDSTGQNVVRELKRYDEDFKKIKSGISEELDEWQTQKNKREAAIKNGIKEYLIEKTKPLFAEKGIYNGKDYLTPSGNRRSFWQLHDEYNLENIVDNLTSQNTKGSQNWAAGYGQIQAQMATQFKSIEDIKRNENKLTDLSQENERLSQLRNAIESDLNEIVDNNDADLGTVSELVADFAKGELTIENFKKLTNDYYQTSRNVSDKQITKLIEDLKELKNMPTDYFEAKPQRAVGLDEIQQLIIPNNVSNELKKELQERNIKYTEYDPNIEGDRNRVVNQFNDLKFSLVENQDSANELVSNKKGTKTKFGELFNNEISPIKEEIKNVSDKLDNLSSQISNIQNQAQNNTIKDDIAPVKNETESINKDTHNENNTTIENNKPSAYIETPKNLNFDRQKYTPLTENDSNLLTDALMNDKNYLKSLSDEDSNHYDNEKLVNNLSKNVSSNLGLGKNQREELKNIIKETIDYDYTTDELADILEKKFTRVENKIVNEEAREIKSLIRTIPIKVSDGIKMDIPDYNDFSRRNFGKIRFTRDGVSVDVAYKALNERLPNYFPDNIVNPSDQLLKIAEVANIANEVVESVEIPKEAIDNIADYITDSIIQDKYNSNLEKNSTLLKDIQFDFVDDILPTTIRTQESIDNYIDSRDITPLRKEVKKRELKEQKEKMSRILKEAFINKNYIIDQTALATGNKEITFTADMLNNVVGEVQYNINGKQTDINGNTIGKGIKEIFAPAKKAGMYEIFNDYLIQKSNIERHAIGKGSRVPLEISKQIVNAYESKYPVLKEWTKDVYKYFDNILLEQYKSGIVSKDQYENFRGENGIYRSYVPFYENTVEESKYYDEEGNVKPFSTLLKAKGNAQDTSGLLSVEDAMVKQTYKYKSAIRANELYKEIVPYLGKYESELPADSRKNPTELDSLFTDVDGTKVLSAYVDGKKMSAQISEELYNELSNTYENKIKELEKDFAIITNPIQKVSNIRRNLITTWNPIFLVRNAIKDIQDAPINSKHTKDMLKTYFGVGEKAAIMELKAAKTKEAQQFLALYGSENTYGDYSELDSKSKNVISKFGKKLVELNELIELAPRYAEFKASLKNGDSLQEAIYNAREVTTNFGRGGYITKALNRNGFTFLNASVQGLDKAIRNITGQNGAKGVTSVILKGALLSVAPAIINELLFGVGDDKDEDYEALPNYIKDNYYLIKVGNNFIRIPKGRINSVFGSLARRTIEGIEGEENPFKGYLDNSWSQIGVGDPSSNNILAPIKQVKKNKAWHGGDIVPTRLQNKPASEQTDAKIDSISNFIGKTFNVSPYKVNYLLDQYSGGIGDVLLPMLSQETKNGADNIFEYLISPLSDSFVVNSTDDNKYPGNFFEKKEELQIQSNSDYATDEDILKYKYFSDVSKELNDLYKERREVQSDTTITQKEKYLKVQKIQKEINSISKNGLTNYNGVNITGNYARVDDKEYYKDTQNEWKKVNDSDSEFIAGMRSNEKSSYFVAKNEISKITKNYKEQIEKQENGAKEVQEQLKREKQKNITNVIINSNLENYSKAMLYAKYYSSEKAMNNVYNAGYDIDTYIDALYNISEIQEKYSKENGYKSATRKKAIYSYINSLNMNIPQKAMLIKKYYSSFKTYNKQIVDYISELDISYEEKMNLIEQNKMKIKNGRVYW